MNNYRLGENRYRDKLKKDKRENRVETNKHKKQNIKVRKTKEGYEKYNHQQLKKTKTTTKLQKKKQYELSKRRASI